MSNFQSSAFPRLTPAVGNILFANVFLFVVDWIAQTRGYNLSYLLGFFYPGSSNFHSWQIISYMFMHGGWEHILFNMFGLYMFGITLENVWGTQRFVFFYFICGLGAIFLQSCVQSFEVHQILGSFRTYNFSIAGLSPEQVSKLTAINNDPTVGASGAIFGILAAFAILFPNTELYYFFIPIPIKAKYFVSAYILWELYLGIANNPGDQVAHFAHIGGALFGYIILKFWNSNNYKRFY